MASRAHSPRPPVVPAHRDTGAVTPMAVIILTGLFVFGGGFTDAVLLLNQRDRAADIAEQAARRVANHLDRDELREGNIVILAGDCWEVAEEITTAHGEGTVTGCDVDDLDVTVTVEIAYDTMILSIVGVDTGVARAQATASPVPGITAPGG